MKFQMSKVLRFRVDVKFERIKNHRPGCTSAELLAQILGKFEEAGEAMRFLDAKRRIAWMAPPRMLRRLAEGLAGGYLL
jgi:hypothetical protein